MSLADDIMQQAGAGVLFQTFGGAITYRPQNADEVPLTAMVGQVEEREIADPDGGLDLRRVRTVVIALDPAASTGGVADPEIGDDIELADKSLWRVQSVTSKSATLATLEVSRPGVIEVSRQGYRTAAI
ncbi:MAG: hypothetical protein ACE5E6_09420 [Phycisphaerae bacterium]